MSSAAQKIIQAAAGNAGAEPGPNVEDVFSTYLYEGNGSTQRIQNGIALGSGDPVISLQGYTFTSIGSTINSSYPLSNINDGVAETSNAQNLTYVADGNFDVYVDLQTPQTVTAYLIAPQGGGGQVYNTPLNFKVHGSSDGSNWTEIEYFQSISTGSSNWTAGTYREFSFTNTTAYRYWRFDHIGDGSSNSGVSISELQFKVDGGDAEVKGGLVWIKRRDDTRDHILYDTERGTGGFIGTNLTAAEENDPDSVTDFNIDGFSLGPDGDVNFSGWDFVSWTFAKQEKFFDVVTYTGDGVGGANAQAISHNLGAKPGVVIVKRTDSTGDWWVFTDVIDGSNDYGYLNKTDAFGNSSNNVPTDSVFNIGGVLNTNNAEYVAYLFAHNDDDGEFGENADQDIIKCGSYTGTGSNGTVIDLGFEPQWLLVKNADAASNWCLVDNMRGVATGGVDEYLRPNTTNAGDSTYDLYDFHATGFEPRNNYSLNNAANDYIYIAIRRGPMKTPESGTEVFDVASADTSGAPSFDSSTPYVDFLLQRNKSGSYSWGAIDRLRGDGVKLVTNSTAAEASNTNVAFDLDVMDGVGSWTGTDTNEIAWMFRRAPGFFDVVAYPGSSSAKTVSHNLGVTPEMIIFKNRTDAINWIVYHKDTGSDSSEDVTELDTSDALRTSTAFFNSTQPTDSVFTVGTASHTNYNGRNYIAYLFATLPGISKVGSYTGNGTSQTIDCGFSAGARFVLIKRTDSTGDWHVYDSERGIVAGNDPRLELNTNSAEDTGSDDIDPVSSGFSVTSNADVNTNTAEYIFLAIA